MRIDTSIAHSNDLVAMRADYPNTDIKRRIPPCAYTRTRRVVAPPVS
ncbi:hypothetical protein H4W79_004075 [Nocardiopsis terrae]|uniref:Uncharacterized protein n=1 Tax=Nocardiopsis terrae TaxID=372655 RepID=A0ABR9HLF2_9ACTN|nr:hypothetical protein [Nocardiopsis terrae]